VRHHHFLRRISCAVTLALVLAGAGAILSAIAAAPAQRPAPAQPAAGAEESPLTLWYRRPAAQWVEALPVGNGRLGAMVFGGIEHERLQLNEDTLWAGGPYDPSHAAAREALPRVRRLVADGAFAEAERLIMEQVIARPPREMPYQTVGDVTITMAGGAEATEYRRSLDLDTAIARTSFRVGNVRYSREVFSSPVDQVIVCRLTALEPNAAASAPGRLTATIAMSTPMAASVRTEGDDTLVLAGVNGDAFGIKGALTYQARVKVSVDGGSLTADGSQLRIVAAKSATLLIAAATSFRRYDDVSGDPAAATMKAIAGAAARPLEAVRADHLTEHRRLFRRVTLDLGGVPPADLPTDERIRRFAAGTDPQLAALYFQYGRYLLIASSRPGTQPANLQGIWNDSTNPPWASNYTTNINTQMNYWPAEVANLAECAEPLFAMIAELAETGARTARTHYGARGWVLHHNSDLWRNTAPVDGPRSGMWPTGGAWLATHLWEHYLYSGDKAFLARAYPIMKGAAEFFLDTLVEDTSGRYLVTSPSLSPENRHHQDGTVAAGPAMDSQILRDLFGQVIEAGRILGMDAAFGKQVAAARRRLAPDRIGSAGQLQEWLEDWDMTAPEPKHRHVSHLYAVFPSAQLSSGTTPALTAAARKSLDLRGDESTGWATAWRIALWARLADPERAHRLIAFLISPARTYPNMFDAHPPFQIDGNFGGTAAMAEMLLQSHAGVIDLLPALPKAWASGGVTGLRARGGFDVDLEWQNGRLQRATIRSTWGTIARLRSGTAERAVTMKPGSVMTWDGR
jgi:alpha-L-fucosidase 2